jgi:hypothetical protein
VTACCAPCSTLKPPLASKGCPPFGCNPTHTVNWHEFRNVNVTASAPEKKTKKEVKRIHHQKFITKTLTT